MAPRRRRNPKIEKGYLQRRGAEGFRGLKPRSGGAYSSWLDVPDGIRNRMNLAARQAAAAVMNDLAEKGPRYSGRFINEWKAISLTGTGSTPEGASYPYETKDIPALKTTAGTMNTVKVFEIFNTSEYAMEAMDLVEGRWRKGDVEPLGGIEFGISIGDRELGPTYRWEVDPAGTGDNVSTAEKDWYENYVRGGGLTAGVKKVVRFTFRSDVNLRSR